MSSYVDRMGQTDKKKKKLGFGQFGWFDQVYFGPGIEKTKTGKE